MAHLVGSTAGGRRQPSAGASGDFKDNIRLLGRISHWHRAGAVAALFLVPLVSLVGRVCVPRWVPVLAAMLVLADRAWGSPTPWPLPTTPSPDFTVYEDLSGKKGAVFVMPTRF